MTDKDATETPEDDGHQPTDEDATTTNDQTVPSQAETPEAASQTSPQSTTASGNGEAATENTGTDHHDQSRERTSGTDAEPRTGSAGQSDTATEDISDEGNPGNSSAEILDKISTLEQTITGVDERVEQLEESLEDHQRRNQHEHEELRKYALEDFAREVLRIKDNLQDAINLEDLPDGTEQRLRILDKQFDQLFTTGQLTKIEPSRGDEYDDHRHRMMNKQQSDKYKTEEIVRVVDPGYAVSDRIIRPAQVVVAK